MTIRNKLLRFIEIQDRIRTIIEEDTISSSKAYEVYEYLSANNYLVDEKLMEVALKEKRVRGLLQDEYNRLSQEEAVLSNEICYRRFRDVVFWILKEEGQSYDQVEKELHMYSMTISNLIHGKEMLSKEDYLKLCEYLKIPNDAFHWNRQYVDEDKK